MRLAHRPSLPLLLCMLVGCAADAGGSTGGHDEVDRPEPSWRTRGARLEVTAPRPNEVLGNTVVEVTGFTSAERVRVNDTTVDAVDGAFAAVVDLEEGANTIRVQAEEREVAVPVRVDSQPPVLEILSPAPGSFVEGEVLEVVGRATDDNLVRVEVDGEAVSFDDTGRFTWRRTVAPGARRLRVIASDQAGHLAHGVTTVLVGEFARPGEIVGGAAQLHVGTRALGELSEGVEPYLSSSYLRPQILARNPLTSGWWGRVDATNEWHGAATVDVTPGHGALEVDVRIEDVVIPLRVDLAVGGDITRTAYVDAATARVTARLGTAGGRPVVTIAATDVELEGLLVDVDGLWSWADRHVVTAAVRGKVESSLDALAARYVPPAVESAVERIPTSYDFSVVGESASVEAWFESIEVTSGGLDAGFGIGIRALRPDPAIAAGAPGSILLDVGSPPSGPEPDVRAAVSLDVVNAALFAGWTTGAVELDIEHPLLDGEPLTVGLLATLAPGVRGLAAPEAPVSLYVYPALPPVVEPSQDGRLEIVLPDVRVLGTARVEGGRVELFELSVGVRAPVRISAADNTLSVSVEDVELTADPIGTEARLPPGPELDGVLADLVGPIPSDTARFRGLKLPVLYGFAFTDYTAEVHEGYLVFRGDLRYTGR